MVKWIHKVGLSVERDGKLLLTRKRGSDIFILPGGKPEGNESDLQALSREIREELNCGLDRPVLLGTFTDVAAGIAETVVVVRLYAGNLVGEPSPCSEIEELAWINMRRPTQRLAPSIENKVLPFLLLRKKRRSGLQAQGTDEPLQGSLKISQ